MSNKVPQIRFNGYSDAWVQRKLVDITTKIGSGKTPKGGSEVYQSNGIALLRSQNVTNDHVDMTDVAFISEEINNTMLGSEVQHNDVLLNITGASIGRSAVYKHTETANVNQHVSIIRLTQGFDPDFVQQLISSFQGQNQIQAFQAGGAREGLNFKQIGLMTFAFPSYDEQLKVSSVVSRLSDLIAANQRKINLLKEQKKGYLQKMFPKNGEKVPELRFAGFADDWEERKLGEISRMYQPLTITGNDLLPDGVPVFGANGFIGFFSEANHIEDQVTISARGEGTGTPSYVHGPVWITGNSMVVNVDDFDINKYFLFANLTANSLKKYVTGGAQPQLTRDVLVKVPITLPNADEQQKIGSFFQQLDNTITLHQRKLDLLKEQKKGFLQKMFV
ncbi:restriction endonuclease subunit S, partial [Levilactobacillus brevis]